jgi:hypothetical protein
MPKARAIEADLQATRRRIARLRRYVAGNLLTDQAFICPHYQQCKHSRHPGDVFREGIMSHVGRHLDLFLAGRPLRVVVVGQESGWTKGPGARKRRRRVSLDTRYQAIHDFIGRQRRYYAEPGYPGRNPHMRGTTSVLRVIFGKGLGTRFEEELVHPTNGRPFHIFDGFALVNRLLCSAGPKDSSQGRPTPTMFQGCLEHFTATMSILEPTIVVVQGSGVEKWTQGVFARTRSYSDHLHAAHLAGQRLLLCTFSHPSAHGVLRWGDSLDAPYLTTVVVPTLQEAIRRL